MVDSAHYDTFSLQKKKMQQNLVVLFLIHNIAPINEQ